MTDWPVDLRGVTESLVATLGPNDRWNLAPLGLHAGDPVTARTWGNTRTRRNFHRRGEGYVQFTRDPVVFVEAALAIVERDDPVLATSDAWAEVRVEQVRTGETDGTRWEAWTLTPVESGVARTVAPTTNRGYYAVIEATVAASRLGVPGYDSAVLRARLDHLDDVARTCGGEREHRAFDRLNDLVER